MDTKSTQAKRYCLQYGEYCDNADVNGNCNLTACVKTDSYYMQNIENISSEELIKDLSGYGVDMYYYDLWKATVNEIARRLGVNYRVE